MRLLRCELRVGVGDLPSVADWVLTTSDHRRQISGRRVAMALFLLSMYTGSVVAVELWIETNWIVIPARVGALLVIAPMIHRVN